jgi:hypothetical protein
MDIICHPMYLAPVSMYARLYAADRLLVDGDTPFVKQTYRNRTIIAAENGPLALTIPVVHNARQPMRDVRISDHGNWRHLHWNALASAYRKSPFFDYYADDFRPFYEKKIEFLMDFNMQLHEIVCNLIGLERTTAMLGDTQPQEPHDLRPMAEPSSRTITGFTAQEYYQVFGRRNGFLADISIADLLFNMGPEGLITLRDSFTDKIENI